MKITLRIILGAALVLAAFSLNAVAQDGGTINTLSVNPRQNIELTNSTGTETGQPSDSVPGSQNEPNGLITPNTAMSGGGTYVNLRQNVPQNQPPHPNDVQVGQHSTVTQPQSKNATAPREKVPAKSQKSQK